MTESIESLKAALADFQRKFQELKKENQKLEKENQELERENQEALADSQRKVQELERENQELERERLLNFDKRLKFFPRNAKGSHSYRSKSSNGDTDDGKQQLRELTNDAKINAKNIFTDNGKILLRCVICGKDESPGTLISVAHIVSSTMDDYSAFGVENGYKDNLDVFSVRNFMPLCGTHGEEGTCRDAIDKLLIHIRYDSILRSYHVDCCLGAPESFREIGARALTTPPGWKPYLRLLAWRSRKCGTVYGFAPDFGRFEVMNELSENSNSVGDADSDGTDSDGADTDDVDNKSASTVIADASKIGSF